MSLLSAVMTLDTASINMRSLDKAIMESAAVKAGVIAKAKEVQDYWKENEAPVSDRGAHPLQKGAVQWDHPGDYKKSIRVKYHTTVPFSATVFTNDPKAHWLEYGSIHNPEYGFAGRVVSHFGGSDVRFSPGATPRNDSSFWESH